jgi:hypothetical protein
LLDQSIDGGAGECIEGEREGEREGEKEGEREREGARGNVL